MEQDDLIKNFCSIANCDADRANFFLSSADWNLEAALNAFYLDPVPDEADAGPVEPVVVSQPAPTAPPSKKPTQPASRFGTIASFRADDDKDSDEENDYYAGGSEHSGQVIRGNPDKIKTKDVFDSAKKHGAEVVNESESPNQSSNQPSFGGSGFRLGDRTDAALPSVPVVNNRSHVIPDMHSTITFWKVGFTVDDGPLRRMDDPANKDFLDSVMRGEIPRELIRLAKGGEVHVKMVDKRTEEYQAPKPVTRPFSGAGFKLGSPTPNVVSGTTVSKNPTNPPSTPTLKVDESAPVTSLQIRLSDGTRLVAKFNHEHTVTDIRNFIDLSRPGTNTSYRLMTTFPKKVIDNESATLKEAGLINAVIVQSKM